MLQTFLFIAVPAIITVTAAFYILNRRLQEGQGTYGPRYFSAGAGNWSPDQVAGGDTVVNRRPRSTKDTSSTSTGECVVCYEESNIVELYPCRHRSLCEDCVLKIISRSRKVCPLCRRGIQGYSDVL